MVERGEAVKTLSSQQLEQLWAEDLKGELETKGKWPLRSWLALKKWIPSDISRGHWNRLGRGGF